VEGGLQRRAGLGWLKSSVSHFSLDRRAFFHSFIHNIKTVGLPTREVANFHWPIKNNLVLKTAGIYIILCRHSNETRIKEHHWHIRLYHPDKSAVAEHNTDLGQYIQFQDTRTLAMITSHMKHITREATDTELHTDNMNREDGFSLGKSRKLLI
jgi:hypothetical protein